MRQFLMFEIIYIDLINKISDNYFKKKFEDNSIYFVVDGHIDLCIDVERENLQPFRQVKVKDLIYLIISK